MIQGFRTSPPVVPQVTVAAVPVRFLFSGEFRFQLPWFQRAYAWTPAQIANLAGNIRDAMQAEGGAQGYPLGTLILARPPRRLDTALVDGHQRIMTLTILFAVLRDLEPNPTQRAQLDALIAAPAMSDRRTAYRLTALADAADLLVTHVQELGSTVNDVGSNWADLSLSEQRIIENRDWLRNEFVRMLPEPELRRSFADYLLDRCWVIVHVAEDEDEAWRRLRLDEDTRLEFDEENRAKASLLSIIPREQRQQAADGWARCEQLLSPADIVALLHHLRLLHMGSRRKKRPIEVDIAEHFDLRRDGLAFIENILLPAAGSMRALKLAAIPCAAARRPLTSLGWLDQNLWMPAALLWQSQRADDDGETADFYGRLERLMWLMRIGGVDPTRQGRRVQHIVDYIRGGRPMSTCPEIRVEKKLHHDAVAALRSPRLGTRRFLGALLRRLSLALGADPGPIDPLHVTIEHLLPRHPKRGSDWNRVFRGKQQVNDYTARLGNLTLMTHAENQAAGCHDWPVKRPVLRGSAFSLSKGLSEIDAWNAGAIDARTERLIATLLAEWQLPVT